MTCWGKKSYHLWSASWLLYLYHFQTNSCNHPSSSNWLASKRERIKDEQGAHHCLWVFGNHFSHYSTCAPKLLTIQNIPSPRTLQSIRSGCTHIPGASLLQLLGETHIYILKSNFQFVLSTCSKQATDCTIRHQATLFSEVLNHNTDYVFCSSSHKKRLALPEAFLLPRGSIYYLVPHQHLLLV